MPIYEYRCRACGRKTNIFVRSAAMSPELLCSHCGSRQLDKLMSRVSLRRGRPRDDLQVGGDLDEGGAKWRSQMPGSFDPLSAESVEDDADPRQLAGWVRQMSQQLGQPLEPELDRALGDVERGADPDEAFDQLDERPVSDPEG